MLSISDLRLQQKSAGDFPTVLYEVISKRSSVIEGTMTIDEVNAILDEISRDLGKQYALRRTAKIKTD